MSEISDEYEEDYQNVYIPNIISQITQNIYLGDRIIANDISKLRKYNIKRIISMGDFNDHTLYKLHDDIDYYFIYIEDNDNEPINMYFNDCVNFINKSNENILIHCYAGISRSATVVIAYLMITENIGFYEAYNKVKNERSFICPNFGFQQQLMKLESNFKK